MHPYELMFIIHPSVEIEPHDALVERVQEMIKSQGGEVTDCKKWGKRRLAYEILDQREGFYVLINYTAEPHVTDELDRVLKITEEVIRFMIVRSDD